MLQVIWLFSIWRSLRSDNVEFRVIRTYLKIDVLAKPCTIVIHAQAGIKLNQFLTGCRGSRA